MKAHRLRLWVITACLWLAAGSAWAQSMDWSLHDLNLAKNRYVPLDQINGTNVSSLALAWSFDVAKRGETIYRPTPLVINGVMYINTQMKLFALNPVTGAVLWSVLIFGTTGTPSPDASSMEGYNAYRQRGPVYGDGRIYVTAPSGFVFAFDAKNGTPVKSFGDNGVLPVVLKALETKSPGKYARDATSVSLGFQLMHPPTYYNGTLFVGLSNGDNNIKGGLLAAVDGSTGKIRWVFNTIPQGPEDEGWAIAGPTWRDGLRIGGGVWTTPAIDPALGLIYFNVGNPSPAFDGSARKGTNLFTNSIVALRLDTGKLAWHFQAMHHDIWDYDVVNGPVLIDANVGGQTVRAVAIAGKTCYVYFLDRTNGTPINPVIETPVPTKSDLPGEEVWPTQPIPYTSRGIPQQPFCATIARVTDPTLASRVRPAFTPMSSTEFLITAPGVDGGANWGASAFSPKAGLFYVVGRSNAQSSKATLVSATDAGLQGPGAKGFMLSRGQVAPTSVPTVVTLTAYDPMTGLQSWHVELNPSELYRSGTLVTGGDLVFHGTSAGLRALDARTGKQLWIWNAPDAQRGVNGDPMAYQIGGKEYISVVAGTSVLTFALP